MPAVDTSSEGLAPQVPKTELEELQIKANSVADEVSVIGELIHMEKISRKLPFEVEFINLCHARSLAFM